MPAGDNNRKFPIGGLITNVLHVHETLPKVKTVHAHAGDRGE